MAKTLAKLHLGTDRKQNDLSGLPDYPCELYFTDLARLSTGYMPEHWHNELEYGLVTKGTLLLTCAGKEYLVEENRMYFINTNVPHAMKSTEDPASFYSIVFHENFFGLPQQVMKKYVEPVMTNPNFQMFLTGESELVQKIRSAIGCYEEKKEKFDFSFHQQLCAIWMLLYDRHLPFAAKEEKMDRRIREMLRFIGENYQENIGVEEIAASAGVSKRECFRCFQQQLSSSPNIYLLQYRMNRAAEKILATDLKMNQIAALCGFASATYFATKFKEIYGMSPKAYRESNQ